MAPLRMVFGKHSDGGGQKKGFEGGKGFVAGVQRRDQAVTERLKMVGGGEGPSAGGDRNAGGAVQESRFTEQL